MQEGTDKIWALSKIMESYLSSPVVKSFLAGSFSGTCSTILFQPLDRVKTLLQCGGNMRSKGLLTVAADVVRNEKLKGLWTGITPSLTRTVPGIGVYFCSLHTIRTHFGSADPHPLESIAVGALARSVSGFAMLPITVVKTRFESGQFKDYRGMSGALVTIYRGEGLKGLYSGMSATLLRDAPFSGLYLMFYTQTKKFVKTSGALENPATPLVHFACGLVAGGLASVVTQPADVIKTHMQLKEPHCGSVGQTVVYVMKTQGGVGILHGDGPAAPGSALRASRLVSGLRCRIRMDFSVWSDDKCRHEVVFGQVTGEAHPVTLLHISYKQYHSAALNSYVKMQPRRTFSDVAQPSRGTEII